MLNLISDFFKYLKGFINSWFTVPVQTVVVELDAREHILSPRPTMNRPPLRSRMWDAPAPKEMLPLLPPSQSPSTSSSEDFSFSTNGYYWKRKKLSYE